MLDVHTFQVIQKDIESGLSRIVRRRMTKADALGAAEWMNLCELNEGLRYEAVEG